MSLKRDVQTKLSDFYVRIHQVGLDGDAYKYLYDVRTKLKKKYKGDRKVTFSDAIRELKKEKETLTKKR